MFHTSRNPIRRRIRGCFNMVRTRYSRGTFEAVPQVPVTKSRRTIRIILERFCVLGRPEGRSVPSSLRTSVSEFQSHLHPDFRCKPSIGFALAGSTDKVRAGGGALPAILVESTGHRLSPLPKGLAEIGTAIRTAAQYNPLDSETRNVLVFGRCIAPILVRTL